MDSFDRTNGNDPTNQPEPQGPRHRSVHRLPPPTDAASPETQTGYADAKSVIARTPLTVMTIIDHDRQARANAKT